jgi:hypothetical protein
MTFVAADWTIAANGDIRYSGDAHGGASPSYATVIELHRALQDFADDAVASGDDLLDITDSTPSDRSTDNIITLINSYNIDDTAAEHLYDGSIIQAGGDTIYDGIVNFGNATFIEVVQNGAILSSDFWNTFTPSGFNADSNSGISHRFLVKVRNAGADIDGRRLLGLQRELGKIYSEFSINGSARGNNVLALSESDDLNNQTAAGTIATWTDIVNAKEGYSLIDADGDTTDEPYFTDWDLGSRSFNDFYERIKWITRRGSGETFYGLTGGLFRGVTHQLTIDTPSGTFQEPESVSWSGGTGQLLAIDSTTAGTKMWIQLLTGVVPADNQVITGGTSSATCQLNVTVTERSISIGGGAPLQSTGSAIIGPYGFGIEAADLIASVNLTDLDNVVRTPPNNVTFTVSGLVSGEDRLLVGPESGGALDVDQDTVNGALSSGATSIVVNGTIPSDTPADGNTGTNTRLRVFNGSTYDSIAYSSFTGSTYTVDSTIHPSGIPNAIADGANIFIGYIDVLADGTSESFTSVFSSSRSLFVRARDGGGSPIKTFETTATLGSAGGSVNIIRTSDA